MTLSGFLKSAAVFCCTFFAVFLHAQTIDDFSDGDLTSNPAWQGDTANFQVNAVFQLQLNAPEEGTSALFLPVGIPDSAVWELYFHLDFDPSSSNRLKVYLHSNSSSLGSGNGYFIQIGDDGTADAIKFYRQDGGNNTLLATSTSAAVAVSPTVRLKMTKENGDTWKLAADYAGGFNYSPEFEVTDATYSADNNGYFGLLCTYTATRKDKFYFDDLSIPSPIPDTEPPVLISATAVSASEVDVFFNESLEEVSATEPANFNINNGIGNPAAVFSDASDKTLLHLSLATPLVSLTSYTLTTSNISDLNNNISLAQSATFSYIKTATAVEYDILINEIMADPTPAVTLPQVEFIELFNRSGKVIDLSGFTFSSGGTPQVFPFFQMLPGSYVIVCDDSKVDSLSDYGEVVVLSSFPALTNEADDLTVRQRRPDLHQRFERMGSDRWPDQSTLPEEVAGRIERSEETVEDPPEQSGSQLDGQWLPAPPDRLPDRQASGVLVDLCDGPVAVEGDHLAGELPLSHTDELVADGVVEPGHVHDSPAQIWLHGELAAKEQVLFALRRGQPPRLPGIR